MNTVHEITKHQTNTDHRCPLKQGNTQSAFCLVHNTKEIRGFHNINSEIRK